jgi:purine-nucleoside phosphorylase
VSDNSPAAIAQSAALVQKHLDEHGRSVPRIALLLGSGWAALADRVADPLTIAYRDLPAFPRLGVDGHRGSLVLGRLGQREVAVLSGRKHAYEEGEADAMKGVVRTLAALGVGTLLQTNAAGSLCAPMRPGELMLITDHINLPQRSPLYRDAGSSRFVDMSDAYDPALRTLARAAAARCGITLREGVYAWVMGPQFETPAEIRMLNLLGAHAVGMSTVPETILARHAGLRVLALSLLTNMACGVEPGELSHAHTLATAQQGMPQAVRLVEAIVEGLEG